MTLNLGMKGLPLRIHHLQILFLKGLFLQYGKLAFLDKPWIPKRGLSLGKKENQRPTQQEEWIQSVRKISKVKDVSNTILIGIPFAEDNEYFSDSTSHRARSREEANETGIT